MYAIGGRGKAGDPFQSVECYNYHSNSWYQVTSLNSRRRHVGVAFMNNLIWAVG
ncbi:Kelch repeat-containing protein, partial [Salmonella sp. s54836]|uniref:Kelch repeat-containing protein n=1 Tax=Salmonella sp. s54836 TaxID=3159673 RepID=UPI00397FDFCD